MNFRGIVFSIIMLFSFSVFAQESNLDRIKAIPAEIDRAVAAENFEKAAALKREKELRLELQEAVKAENYQKAATIKQQIVSGATGSGTQLGSLENQLQQAINNEEYTKAAQLQKEIDALKNGESTQPHEYSQARTTNSASSGNNASYGTINPQFVNQVYFWGADGNLYELEKAEGQLKTSGGGFGGYASATSSYMIPGPRSNVRIEPDQLNFVVKTYQGIDPSQNIKLVKMEVRGRRSSDRYADAYKSSSAMFHSETGAVSDNNVAISFKSIGENVFQIVIEGSLPAGEYAFMHITQMYAFGID